MDARVLTTIAQACRDSEPIRFGYTARDDAASDRWVEPHRLVTLGRRWYLVAYDRDRDDWRSFRLDRVADPRTTGQHFRRRDIPGGDALAFVQSGIRRMPQRYAVRVRIEAPADRVRRAVWHYGDVEETGLQSCVLTMNVDSLEWPLMVLGQLEAPFEVESPEELVAKLGRVATIFRTSTATTPDR